MLTIPNPAYEEAVRFNRYAGKTPRRLKLYRVSPDRRSLLAPRGAGPQIAGLCSSSGCEVEYEDRTRSLPDTRLTTNIKLQPHQRAAADTMMKTRTGVLSSPTGSGKTVMALELIARREQPALIVVHTKELAQQWIARVKQFVPNCGKIGLIGSGKNTIGDKITVGLVQTLVNKADDIYQNFGHLVVDECHRTPSRTFTEVVSKFDCMHMTGLSATPWRRDKLSQLIYWYLGPLRHEVKDETLIDSGALLPIDVIIRTTEFVSKADPVDFYSKALSELADDETRNGLISWDIAAASKMPGVILALTDRKSQCEHLARLVRGRGVNCEILTGSSSKLDREGLVADLDAGKIKVLIATGQLIGEGFDCKSLSTLFIGTPIKFNGRLIQYLGRVRRPAPGKTRARIYDYIDEGMPSMVRSALERLKTYKKGGGK